MRRFVAFVAFAALSSVTAFAADMAVKAPAKPIEFVSFNWTGWYVGVDGGSMSGSTSNDVGFPNVRINSGFIGVQGGYRWQFANNMVLGLQVVVPLWTEDQAKTIAAGIQNTGKVKASVLGQVQLGYAMGRWLPFVTGGIGAARVSGQENTSLVVDNTHTLGTAGLGINYAITDHITTGVVWNHLWASREKYNCGPAFCGVVAGISYEADTFAGVLEYKF